MNEKQLCATFEYTNTSNTINPWNYQDKTVEHPFKLPSKNDPEYLELVGYIIKIQGRLLGQKPSLTSMAKYQWLYQPLTLAHLDDPSSFSPNAYQPIGDLNEYINPNGSDKHRDLSVEVPNPNPNDPNLPETLLIHEPCIDNSFEFARAKIYEGRNKIKNNDLCFLSKDSYRFLLNDIFLNPKKEGSLVISGSSIKLGQPYGYDLNEKFNSTEEESFFTLKFESSKKLLADIGAKTKTLKSSTPAINSPNIAFAVPCPPLWEPPQ